MKPTARSIASFAIGLLVVFLFPWQGLVLEGGSWVPQGLYSRDTLGNRLVAANLARGNGFDLSPYFAGRSIDPLLREQMLFAGTDGALIPRFPVLTGLMATPFFVAAASPMAPPPAGVTAVLRGLPQRELYAAAAITTLSAVIMLLLLTRITPAGSPGLLAPAVTFGFVLGSPWWSANSQALWSHTGSSFWVALFLWLTWQRSQLSWRLAALSGFVLALAAWCRPSHLVSIAVVGAVLLSDPRERRSLPAFCAAAAAGLGLMAASSLVLYGDPLGPYIRQLMGLGLGKDAVAGGATHAGFLNAITGMLLSPSVGLLVFCPWVAVACMVWKDVWRQGWWGRSALLIVVIQMLLIARNPLWWGGWCYGPRLFADILPFLAPLLIMWLHPAAQTEGATSSPSAMRKRLALLGLLFVWSIALQFPGAALYRFAWHAQGDDLAQAPWRLWWVSDGIVMQTLREHPPQLPDELLHDRELWSITSLTANQGIARFPCDPSHDLWLLVAGAIPNSQCQWTHLSGAPVWIPLPELPERGVSALVLVLSGPLSERTPLAVDATGRRYWLQRAPSQAPDNSSRWRIPNEASLAPPVFVRLGDFPAPITSALATIPEIRLSTAPEWHLIE